MHSNDYMKIILALIVFIYNFIYNSISHDMWSFIQRFAMQNTYLMAN